MATKQCSKCKEKVQEDAKKCKHCKADLRNWFVRHKIITGFLVLLIIGSFASVGEKSNSSNENKGITESNTNTQKEEKSEGKITKGNCDKIQADMTIKEVKAILGEPSSTSESEIAGFGKTEYLHFQEGFKLESCSITAMDGKVSSRTWTKL